jgi:YVTN family beta-propeller protein
LHSIRARSSSVFLGISLLAQTGVAASAASKGRAVVGGSFAGTSFLPTGVYVTPTAARGSKLYRLTTGLRPDGNADATDASATALSPDGKTLLVATTGYNTGFNNQQTAAPFSFTIPDPLTGASTSVTTPNSEWVFVYDVTGNTPQRTQIFSIPNTYVGLVWAPNGKNFYVSGGIDDRILAYKKVAGSPATYATSAPAVILKHNADDIAPIPDYHGGLLRGTAAAKNTNNALATGAVAAGLAISRDGKTLVVANFENDSLSIVDTASRSVTREVAFAPPGSGIARGEFPFGVAVVSDESGKAKTAYVSSMRDSQVLAVDLVRNAAPVVIPVGSGPNAMTLSPDGTRLYVADGNSDDIAIIDTRKNVTAAVLSLGGVFKGRNPNGLTLSRSGERLYVTLGGENSVAVIDLRRGRLVGKIPTAWYPTGVAVAKDDSRIFIVNEKSVPGPNPTNPSDPLRNTNFGLQNPTGLNQYGWAIEKAGLAVVPMPSDNALVSLTQTVNANNGTVERNEGDRQDQIHRRYDDDSRNRIDHVIYIVKENRTYDQVLGDLGGSANGDPRLTVFPEPITPNHHALARDFVTLDNFYDPGESSGVGWKWTTGGQTNDFVERTQAALYGNASFNGLTYDYEGQVRNNNLALPQTGSSSVFATRETGLADPSGSSSILPGPRDPASYDGDGDLDRNAIGGYIWDEALRRGLTVRNYGFYADLQYYGARSPGFIPIVRDAFARNARQETVTKVDLAQHSDPYFRGFDNAAPDTFRYEEWAREFDGYVKNKNLPNLEFVRIMHDHFGKFSSAVAGLNTPALQMADNDYALGKIVERVSHSPYWRHTAIFVIEDDPQDGPDHVDMHRSIALVAGPTIRRGAVVHDDFTTVNVLRTIEDLLGLRPLGFYDHNATAMTTIFAKEANDDAYDAIVPGSLCASPVDPVLIGPDCRESQTQGAQRRRVRRPFGTPFPQSRPNRRVSVVTPDLHDAVWWSAMTTGMNFDEADKVDPRAFNAVLWYGMTGTIAPSSAVL